MNGSSSVLPALADAKQQLLCLLAGADLSSFAALSSSGISLGEELCLSEKLHLLTNRVMVMKQTYSGLGVSTI